MNQNQMNNNDNNLVKGLLIALGFGIGGGLIGGALWFGLSFLGRMAAISGIVAGLGGGLGGMISGENNRPLKFIISVIISLGLFAVGVYCGMGVDIYTALDGAVSLDKCINLIPEFFSEQEVASAFIFDAVLGLITYIIGIAAAIVKLKDM